MLTATANAIKRLKIARTTIEVRTEPAAANLSSLSHFDVEFAWNWKPVEIVDVVSPSILSVSWSRSEWF